MTQKLFILTTAIALGAVSAQAATRHRVKSETTVQETATLDSELRPNSTENSGNLGVGLMLGEPSGVTVKYWTSSRNAFAIGGTYSFGNFFEVLVDYTWQFPGAFSAVRNHTLRAELVPYFGIGAVGMFSTISDNARLDNRANAALGSRIPVGVEFLPAALPLGIFTELAPGITIVPDVTGYLQGALGIHFYI